MPCQTLDIRQVGTRLRDLLDGAGGVGVLHCAIWSGSQAGGGRGEGVEGVGGDDDPAVCVRWIPGFDHWDFNVSPSADPVAAFDLAVGYRVALVLAGRVVRGGVHDFLQMLTLTLAHIPKINYFSLLVK